MSILVLGAGTDYALLEIVARYREEMHREVDKYVAMRNALTAGPAVFASAMAALLLPLDHGV